MEAEDLDIAWIHEQEQLLNTDNYQISPLHQIPIHIVYVNKQGVVENKDTIQYTLTNETLDHSALLLLQHNYQKPNYECIDIVYFHFNILPEHIQDLVASNGPMHTKDYFKTYVGENGIHFSPIIKLFHVFSSIYFFFRELTMAPPPLPPKPILKLGEGGRTGSSGTTKKVRIVCDTDVPSTPASNRQKRNQIGYNRGRKTRKCAPIRIGATARVAVASIKPSPPIS
jgi:hypothetical protein